MINLMAAPHEQLVLDSFENWSAPSFRPENPAPIDEKAIEFGMPIVLPIAQTVTIQRHQVEKLDGHHASGFPTSHPDLQESSNRIMRYARIQEGDRRLHNRYHSLYDGTILPETIHHYFKTALFYVANYVPEYGVDVGRSKPQLILLSGEMQRQLHSPLVLHQQRGTRWRIGHFFGQYITQYGLEPIKESVEVAKFLEAKRPIERYRLGHEVIRLAAESVTEPVEGLYQTARLRGNISQAQPPRALRFLMKHFDDHQVDYFDTIDEGLKQLVA